MALESGGHMIQTMLQWLWQTSPLTVMGISNDLPFPTTYTSMATIFPKET